MALGRSRGRSPVLDDQPASDDRLGFTAYCASLRDLILNTDTQTPLTLGIFGRWGTGKTTLMRMLEGELRRQKIPTVWFNAWQYSKEDELWAAFLQSLLNRIQSDLSPLQRPIFSLRLLLRRVDWPAAPELALQYVGRAVVVALPLVLAWPAAQALGQGFLSPTIRATGGLASAALAAWLLLKPVFMAVQQNVKIDFNQLRKGADYKQHIAFLDSFREHFKDVVWSLPGHGDKRLVVFVDDLDRCSPDGTLQVLDAIKLFVDTPGCIYVLGLDNDVVLRAVSTKYKDDPIAQQEYLGKIIQLPFQLPVLTRADMLRFVEYVAPELPDSRCRDVFVEGLPANPREMKRAISIFSMLWGLSALRPELAPVIKPVRLAKVVVIRHSHPDLYRLLQDRPEWLSLLEAHSVPIAPKATVSAPAVDQGPALPSSLTSYAAQDDLRRVLSLFPPGQFIDDDASFGGLGPEEITMYFTLTWRMETPLGIVPSGQSALPIFSKRYDVLKFIGEGGMSKVYLAFDRDKQRRVAIKVLLPQFQADPKTQARFRREIQVLYRLDYPNIIRFYDQDKYLDHGEELVYFAMEYLNGKTLQEILRERVDSPEKWLSVEDTVSYMVPILDALSHVHGLGIVHRDIKPSTIGITAAGVPKLMDFGIAKFLSESENRESKAETTAAGVPVGTPGYISPEQMSAERPGPASDLYSFGVVMYECLTGRRPFAAESELAEMIRRIKQKPAPPRASNPNIPPALEAVVLRLMEINPKDRYSSANETKSAILEAVGGYSRRDD